MNEHLQTIKKAIEQAQRALRPIAGHVYNDNGDMWLNGSSMITFEQFCDAYFANKALDLALKVFSELPETSE